MDKENQFKKLCCLCSFEKEYDEYHRVFAASIKAACIRCAKHFKK